MSTQTEPPYVARIDVQDSGVMVTITRTVDSAQTMVSLADDDFGGPPQPPILGGTH